MQCTLEIAFVSNDLQSRKPISRMTDCAKAIIKKCSCVSLKMFIKVQMLGLIKYEILHTCNYICGLCNTLCVCVHVDAFYMEKMHLNVLQMFATIVSKL